jgi:hypothetical protein
MARSSKRTPIAAITALLRTKQRKPSLNRHVRRVERQRLRTVLHLDEPDDHLTTIPPEIAARAEIRGDCKVWLGTTELEARRRALRK